MQHFTYRDALDDKRIGAWRAQAGRRAKQARLVKNSI